MKGNHLSGVLNLSGLYTKHACTHTHTHTHMHTHMRMHMHTYKCTLDTKLFTYTYLSGILNKTCMLTHTHTYTHMHTHTHAHTCIYTHTYTLYQYRYLLSALNFQVNPYLQGVLNTYSIYKLTSKLIFIRCRYPLTYKVY